MEKRGNLPVTRSTFRGSGIALFIETSNAEAHADMYINEQSAERSLFGGLSAILVRIHYIPMGIYRCFVIRRIVWNCQIPECQSQSVK